MQVRMRFSVSNIVALKMKPCEQMGEAKVLERERVVSEITKEKLEQPDGTLVSSSE